MNTVELGRGKYSVSACFNREGFVEIWLEPESDKNERPTGRIDYAHEDTTAIRFINPSAVGTMRRALDEVERLLSREVTEEDRQRFDEFEAEQT